MRPPIALRLMIRPHGRVSMAGLRQKPARKPLRGSKGCKAGLHNDGHAGDNMKLICYTLDGKPIDIEPASNERDWIDNTRKQFAKRCLPLVTANSHGWQILCQDGCWARWNGGIYPNDTKVKTDSGKTTEVSSHFGHGILTFQVHCLLRTEPGYNTWVTGPVNRFKDGIQPMSAMLETDWMPYTFTMNWQITRKRKWLRFEKGEPIAQFFPVPRRIVDDCDPQMMPIATDADLQTTVDGWHKMRKDFLTKLNARDPETEKEGWQKHYFRGLNPDGSQGSDEHQTRVRPKPFIKPLTLRN